MPTSECNIKYLRNVFRKEYKFHQTIINQKISKLTGPGEHYGSDMLKVDITVIDDESHEKKTLHMVAKKIPRTTVFQEVFNIQIAFKNEIAFYELIAPTLAEFQRESGVTGTSIIDKIPRCYGSRYSLNRSSSIVDEDAVLLLENLKYSGYVNVDRVVGFDLETTTLILKDLAEFHGTGLALKIKKPHVFNDRVKRYCHDFQPPVEFSHFFINIMKTMLQEDAECAALVKNLKYWGQEEKQRKSRDRFATIAHCDLWVNNTLQKFENGRVVANKFVDFQIYTYRSLVVDVFFLLFTSVQRTVLENHLDSLLKYYHGQLIDNLEKLQCDTSSFSYDNFIEDITFESRFECPHVLHFLIFLIRTEQKFDGDLSKINEEIALKQIPEETKLAAFYSVKELHRRGWLH